jgi:hypothetical protein
MSNLKVNAAVYGAVLAVLMGAAWFKWTAEPEIELDGQVVLLQGEEEGLEKVVWLAKDKNQAIIERRSDDYGDYFWVTTTKWTAKKKEAPPKVEDDKPGEKDEEPADDGKPGEKDDGKPGEKDDGKPGEKDGEPGDAAEDAEPEVEEVIEYDEAITVFKAGDAGVKLATSLSPMLAIRRLDQVDDAKLESIGLKAPTDFIEVTRKGRVVKLELGGEVYGTRDRYVRDVTSGNIYLVDDEVLRPLKYARTRLPDRQLWDLELQDITQVGVSDGAGVSATYVHKNPDDEAKAWWMRDGGAEEKDTQVDTWMKKALTLRGTRYADPAKPLTDLQDRFSLILETSGGKSLTVLVQQEGDTGDFWASSAYTRGHLKLLKTATDALSDDVSAIVE